jgi:hypothetical protein
VISISFQRTEDGEIEILTIVRIDSTGKLAMQVVDEDDNFCGVYSLDGDPLNLPSGAEWSIVSVGELTPEEIGKIERDWERGTSVVKRLWPKSAAVQS